MNNYKMSSPNKLLIVASVGVASLGVGWFGGSYYEKSKLTKFNKSNNLPATNTEAKVALINKPTNNMIQVQQRTSEIMKYGFPSLEQIRSFDDFVLSYDRRNKVPNWVFEHLSADKLNAKEKVDRTKCDFKEDLSIHPYFRSTNEDYKSSGFDRGHMAAAGNHHLAQKHCDQTFFLTNISPQVGAGFNRHSWNRLEKYVRKLTKTFLNVYVCTGPLYLPRLSTNGKKYVTYQVIGKNNVAVPTHFFKVVIMETERGELYLETYVMPNERIDDSTPLSTFLVPPELIEKSAGLLFFEKISKQNLVKVNGAKNYTLGG